VDRTEALALLRTLVGSDLVVLGNTYGVTIWKGTRINKGWAGHTIERHLGLPLNSSRSPNFGSWELKVVPVRAMPDGTFKVKETMAITMIDPVEVAKKEFRDSHLFLSSSEWSSWRESLRARWRPDRSAIWSPHSISATMSYTNKSRPTTI